ncbi:hypothetical protein FCL54_07040 [Pseudalkalibacillus caeni]|uniref:Uncharacterized protein n=2 Tax=Exobacillus caeni TaxID=2574798 RepID=A0A5R9F3U7_9BACL|nr:hypothetical protein FCL54_07040 [Pseudalkalibacillus caeni]
MIIYGERKIPLPEDAIISITLGARFNIWRTIVNGFLTRFVMKQMMNNPGLLYAELVGNMEEGYGQTMTVWESKAMVPFRDSGSHKFSMKFFSWVFYSGKVHAYFSTYKANGYIPTFEEANQIAREYGRFFEGGKLIRKAQKPDISKLLKKKA